MSPSPKKDLTALSPGAAGVGRPKGAAVLAVLAVVTLATVLTVSMLQMSQSARSASLEQAENEEPQNMRDTAVSLFVAQLSAANQLIAQGTGDPKEGLSWTTQPGALRSYSNSNPANNRLFKLYSSPVPVISAVQPGENGALLARVQEDLADDWASRPDEYTDLNLAISQNGELRYPIADPRMYNGNPADTDINTEGFRYGADYPAGTMDGVDPALGRLAMPMRWIYQLRDGSFGWLNRERVFQPLDSSQAAAAISPENPIVGRMAWWADDETCKVNLNTASLPAIWDTPRTTSLEDVWLAKGQPLAGEYQRYPGHPATVDLSAVFFPGRRWTGTDGSWTMPAGASMKGTLTLDEANLLWGLTPFITNGLVGGEGGTLGGTRATPSSLSTVLWKNSPLFASIDEAALAASGQNPNDLNGPRVNPNLPGGAAGADFLQRLTRSQFFLTHRSSSMEMTNSGYPRVGIFPVDTRSMPYVGTSTPVPSDGSVSPYDISMASAAMLGKKPYFVQRRDPNSRHAELYSVNGAADPARNSNLFKYLKELSRLPLAGYPPTFPGAKALTLTPTLPEDAEGRSFAAKYPPGHNPATGERFASSNSYVANGQTLMDASDRTQILLNTLDFTRSINMQTAFLSAQDRYDDGNGQATGLCGCGYHWDTFHSAALTFTNANYRCPKGAGKLLVPAEVSMVVNIAAMKNGLTAFPSSAEWNKLQALIPTGTNSYNIARDTSPGIRYMVEVGFVMSGFNPKTGWSPVNPRGGIAISSTSASWFSPVSDAGSVLPVTCSLGGNLQDQLRTCATVEGSTGANSRVGTPRPTATGLIPYGGLQGPRSAIGVVGEMNNNNFAICAPLCIEAPPGSSPGSIKVGLSAHPGGMLRIMQFDGEYVSHNVLNAVDIRLPQNFGDRIQIPYSGVSLRTQALNYTNNPETYPFPDPRTVVRSLVIPHGDYRLATSMRMDQDLYVAHAQPDKWMAHSLYEANETPARRQMAFASYNPMTLINREDAAGTPGVAEYIAPGGGPMSSLPLPLADPADMRDKSARLRLSTGDVAKAHDPAIAPSASRDSSRQEIFAFGRRDGQGKVPRRGSTDPDETGDFDNGPGAAEDGPYMNYPDEGDRRRNGGNIPYFTKLTSQLKTTDGKAAQCISPNFLLRSPVDFGSIPSGLQARVPWQTLRFRPDPGMNDPAKTMGTLNETPPPGLPFANFCGPRDHFFLDMFWMPVVEPWAISAMTSTQGTINLNQQILPFLYIERSTALHALLRGERMLAIPNAAAAKYKKVTADGTPDNPDPTYRHFINAGETLKQFTKRWAEGKDPEDFPLAFNTFRSASEVCELWLVPDKNGGAYETDKPWDLSWIIGRSDATKREGFWVDHRLTGDNSRERPYANLYPRVTVRSNVFKLHLITQALDSPPANAGAAVGPLTVSEQWRGHCFVERSMDPNDSRLQALDHTNLNVDSPNATIVPRLEKFQSFTVSGTKEFAPLP